MSKQDIINNLRKELAAVKDIQPGYFVYGNMRYDEGYAKAEKEGLALIEYNEQHYKETIDIAREELAKIKEAMIAARDEVKVAVTSSNEQIENLAYKLEEAIIERDKARDDARNESELRGIINEYVAAQGQLIEDKHALITQARELRQQRDEYRELHEQLRGRVERCDQLRVQLDDCRGELEITRDARDSALRALGVKP